MTATNNTLATSIMEEMLLSQYRNSPNLKEYLGCYMAELDELFVQMESVIDGRLLDNATGYSLDIIGRILVCSRGIEVPVGYFGFEGADGAKKMANRATPTDGGIFLSQGKRLSTTTALSDTSYRRLLKARAYCITRESFSIDDLCTVIELIVGRTIPQTVVESGMALDLRIRSANLTSGERIIIRAVKDWFIPMGVSFKLTIT